MFMKTAQPSVTGLYHTTVCIALGAALALLLAADSPQIVGVPPGLDAAAQRLRIEDQLIALNGKMDQLIGLLRSGNLKVICVPADTEGRGSEYGRMRDAIMAPCNQAAPASDHAR
jgi:hypothetical protein